MGNRFLLMPFFGPFDSNKVVKKAVSSVRDESLKVILISLLGVQYTLRFLLKANNRQRQCH